VVADKTHHAVCVQIVRLLREERERQGLTKYAMAQRSGLSEQMLGYVERGMRQPSLETVVRMAAGLEVDLGDIVKRAQKALSRMK
jgi:transcriptional regulator with XRE-family HTH domain